MEVQTHEAPKPEDQAHIDAMVAKADGKETPAGQPQSEGDFAGLGSKEALEKAYTELRAKMSKDGAPKAEEPAAGEKAEAEEPKGMKVDKPADDAAAAAAAVEKAGLDLGAVEAEFAKDGKLADETYESLAKAGFDRDRVDSYIAGQTALAEQLQSRVAEHVGGAEQMQSMLKWAADGGLSAEEAEAFNSVVDSSGEAGIKLAMDGLKAKFVAANGSDPKLIGGSTSGNSGDVFNSNAELTTAMRDPRYANDPAYRDQVIAKLGRSKIM